MMIEILQNELTNKLKFINNEKLQQRGFADSIEQQVRDIAKSLFQEYHEPSSRRSIEDFSIDNVLFDVKSSDITLKFKMPNLISIDRLRKLSHSLYFIFVIYDSKNKCIVDVKIFSIYQLNWNELAIQNLGKGQLQIKNMQAFLQNPFSLLNEEEWKLNLTREAKLYYTKLKAKIEKWEKTW